MEQSNSAAINVDWLSKAKEGHFGEAFITLFDELREDLDDLLQPLDSSHIYHVHPYGISSNKPDVVEEVRIPGHGIYLVNPLKGTAGIVLGKLVDTSYVYVSNSGTRVRERECFPYENKRGDYHRLLDIDPHLDIPYDTILAQRNSKKN